MSPAAKRKRPVRDAPGKGKAGEPTTPQPKLKRAAKQSLHPIAAARLTNRRRTR